ncbi:phosphoglycerate mutase-like protein AT74H isoform X2 [Physcomitrium patens]|uniref:Phosphoglycerate mutase-like protein AT74H n=1 Tax=Physcomitrium patens TaxID=3218 RepID=A0A7I4DY97_PHYPA|nr:phosphoglycerate mutase-like protein AT74H isoform X2 [Physcomitrium patens]|eukprot:XP_024378235.1 phosphoglycerate mutase-like protein AT74H isoform X2 [Physcomitrella patens]
MVLGQVMLPVLAGKKVSGLMIVTGSGIHDPCAGVTEANKFRNVSVHHSVNGWCLRRTGNFNLMKKSFDSSSLISRASSQAPFNPLQYQSYSIPSLNWRNKGVKRLIEGYNTQEVIQRGRPVEFSESTIASLFSEHNGMPPRPRRIILVRHGESLGNVDETAYTQIPDSKICLTEKGWKQALKCGHDIRELIEGDHSDDWKVYFYVSPYNRTLQTLRGIGIAFDRERIAGVREEPRLREQDFGNFQDRERMRVEKAIRLRYGRFFYRFPNGESAADVYDRITGFRETLRADIDVGRFQRPESRSKNMNLVLVSHGLTLRVFLMRWYKWTVQQFEGLYNFGNTEMLVMELGPGGRYSLTMHHSADELRAFGMTDDMIEDQEWQKIARPGELNNNWDTNPSFFHHFDAAAKGLDLNAIPDDIVRYPPVNGATHSKLY